jgi:hypothetical protein
LLKDIKESQLETHSGFGCRWRDSGCFVSLNQGQTDAQVELFSRGAGLELPRARPDALVQNNLPARHAISLTKIPAYTPTLYPRDAEISYSLLTVAPDDNPFPVLTAD